jgi:hypothetical protein
MNQALSVQQLTDKLTRLEMEVKIIRQELVELRQQSEVATRVSTRHPAIARLGVDREMRRRWMNDVFTALSIRGAPIGAEMLQQRMSQAGLTPNELSRSLVDAREE